MDDPEHEKRMEELGALVDRIEKPLFNEKTAFYENGLVSFIDTLGFSEFISNSSVPDIANSLRYFHRLSDGYAERMNVEVINFSDSTIRVRTILTDPTDVFGLFSPLVNEIHALAVIQFLFACCHGLFLRGGLTFGDIFYRSGIVFGPALINAYQLEAKQAIYPRILVDQKLIRSLDEYPTLLAPWSGKLGAPFLTSDGSKCENQGLEYTKYLLEEGLLVDDKNNFFLDYLGMSIKGADRSFVLSHKEAIESKYEMAKDDRVREKLAWLKEYHNFAVCSGDDFREIGITEKNIENFTISDDTVPALPVRPTINRFRFCEQEMVPGTIRSSQPSR